VRVKSDKLKGLCSVVFIELYVGEVDSLLRVSVVGNIEISVADRVETRVAIAEVIAVNSALLVEKAFFFKREKLSALAAEAGDLGFFGSDRTVDNEEAVVGEFGLLSLVNCGKVIACEGIVFKILDAVGGVARVDEITLVGGKSLVMGGQAGRGALPRRQIFSNRTEG